MPSKAEIQAELDRRVAPSRDAIMAELSLRDPEQPKTDPQPEQEPDFMQGLSRAVGRGATWGMSDIIEAGIKAPIYAARTDMTLGEAYTYARDAGEEKREAFTKEHPFVSGAAEIGAGITSGISGAKLAAAKAPKLARKLKELGKKAPLRTGAGVAGVSGGVYAAGTTRGTPSERLQAAALPGVASAALGPVGVLAVRGAGKVAGGVLAKGEGILGDIAEKRIARGVGREPVLADKGIRKIVDKLRKDYPDPKDFQRALQEYSESSGVSLAEIGDKNLTSLATGVAQYPSGGARTEKFIEERMSGVSGRIKTSVAKYIDPDTDFYGTIDDVLEKGRAKAAPLYDKAYKANLSMESKEIDLILDTPAGRKALKEAAEMMKNDRALMGLPDKELKSIQRDLSAVGKMDEVSGPIARGLNMRTLDAVKKSMDDQISVLYRKGENNKAKIINDQKNALLREMDIADKTGAYKKGRAIAGDYLSTSKAMEDGRNFIKLDADLIKRKMADFTPSEREAYKAGVVRKMRDLVDTAQDSSNLYKRVFGKEEVRNKIKAIVGEVEFKKLSKSLRAEERLYKFAYKVVGNSSTSSKQQAAADFAENLGMDAVEAVATHGIQSIPRRVIGSALRNMKLGLTDESAAKVADILYETNPAKKLEILKKLSGSSEGQKAIQATLNTMESVKIFRIGRQALEETVTPGTVGIATGVTVGEQ